MGCIRFKLNPDKTHLMTVGTSERLQTLTEKLRVAMDNVNLEETEGIVELLLGIKMQSNLKWSEQIQHLAGMLKSRLNGLDKLKQITGRPTRRILCKGYSTVNYSTVYPCLVDATILKCSFYNLTRIKQEGLS